MKTVVTNSSFRCLTTGSCEVYLILDGVQLGSAHGIPVLGAMHPLLLTDKCAAAGP